MRLGSTMFRVETERCDAEPEPPIATHFGRVVGASREMRRLYPLCARLASTDVPVVIEGETGTGKEALAESLHEVGPRAHGPFVVFDCTAVPANLLEAELFGHERGAYTGAVGMRRGVFEQADGGTLLIDEIGDLDVALQAKLLRAIERGEVRRIGSDRWSRVNVRVLAATRRNLDHEVQAGRFRDDLFHRLAVVRIELPPLRRRVGDVPTLIAHFWREMGGAEGGIPSDVLRRWEDYAWPGNVRELRNAIARQLALGELASRDPSTRGDASARVTSLDALADTDLPFSEARDRVIQEFETRYIARALARHDGDGARAAAAAGIGVRYLQKLRARNPSR